MVHSLWLIHLIIAVDQEQVRSLITRVEREQGQLNILIDDIGAEHFAEFDKPIWEVDLERGRASGKRGIDIIQVKKINPVLRSNALSTMQPR